jgi:hypothetical protein
MFETGKKAGSRIVCQCGFLKRKERRILGSEIYTVEYGEEASANNPGIKIKTFRNLVYDGKCFR